MSIDRSIFDQRAMPVVPVFTAVIPAYNAERFVGRAIKSVLAQRDVEVECIVVDDGSHDRTSEVAQSFGSRVRVIRQANGGASAARNTGIRVARGEYLAFLDADDYWLDTKLACQSRVIGQNADVALVSTLWTWLPSRDLQTAPDFAGPDPCTITVDRRPGWDTLLLDPYLCTPSVVVRTEDARACGGFDTSLPSAEDIDFFMRVCGGRPYAVIDAPLVCCQLREGSLTQTENSHSHNLVVLDRIAEQFSEILRDHASALAAAKTDVYVRWVRSLIFRGHGAAARDVIKRSRYVGGIPGYWPLWVKSYFSPVIRHARELLRPDAAEDQVWRSARP